jgi:hypothetical protein
VVHLGQPVLDPVLAADPVEDVPAVPDVLLARGEPHAVVGEHRVDAVGHRRDQAAQELRGLHLARAPHEAGEGELARAVGRHEQAQLALFGADLGEVDVEVAERVAREAFLLRLVAFGLRQPADAVPFQAAVQAGAREMRDGRLQAVEAVVQRQERVPAEGDDGRLLLRRQDGRANLFRAHAGVARALPTAPFLHGRRADAVALGRRPHALFT